MKKGFFPSRLILAGIFFVTLLYPGVGASMNLGDAVLQVSGNRVNKRDTHAVETLLSIIDDAQQSIFLHNLDLWIRLK